MHSQAFAFFVLVVFGGTAGGFVAYLARGWIIIKDRRERPSIYINRTDITMPKIYAAFRTAGLADDQATDVVTAMQNSGIRFQEYTS